MAKRKLNKKVAVLGIVVLAVLVTLAALILRKRLISAEKLVAQAQAQWQQIQTDLDAYNRAAASGGSKEKLDELRMAGEDAYRQMLTTYREAVGRARSDDYRIRLLFELADHYLRNNAFHAADWDKALRAWYTVTTLDPAHLEARMKLLQYFYDAGDSGNRTAWVRVKEQVEEIIQRSSGQPDAFVLKARGRAYLEMAASGEVTDRAGTVDKAIADFEGLLKATPGDVELSQYLAQAIVLRGRLQESMGRANAQRQAYDEALAVLKKATESMPDNVQAHVNILQHRLAAVQGDRDALNALAVEFEGLAERFEDSAEAHAALARYYQLVDDLDKAVDAMRRAMERDPQSVTYAAEAANLYYVKGSSQKNRAMILEAIDIANKALTLPEAQDIAGPRENTFRNNRARLHGFLAMICADEALAARAAGDSAAHQEWIARTQRSVSALQQIFRTETHLAVTMWTGILGMATNNDPAAIAKMVSAYEQIEAAGGNDATLAYFLARAFQDSPEMGSRMWFLRGAISGGIGSAKPEMLLEYADLLTRIRAWAHVQAIAEMYENTMAPTERSIALRVEANIGMGNFARAEEILQEMDASSPKARGLKLALLDARILHALRSQSQQALTTEARQQLDADLAERAALTESLLDQNPDEVPFQTVANVCSHYLGEKAPKKARALIEAFLAKNSDHTAARVYQRQLMEPDPMEISAERREAILLEVLREIGDPLERNLAIGQHYLMRQQYEEAAAAYEQARHVQPDNQSALDGLFETILAGLPDRIADAEALARTARDRNLDGCNGDFYFARLALARRDYTEAMNRIEACLKVRPIYSHAFYLRSQINANLDNHEQAIADILEAASINPLDPAIARHKAALLHARNNRLGTAVTSEQREEAEMAMREAILLNPNDVSLQSVYAEYRSEKEPKEALAQRQYLARRFPNKENYRLLGNMAMRIAQTESDEVTKAGLMEIAENAFEQAWALAPNDPAVQQQYSEFLRMTGQHQRVEELFGGDKEVLWRYYLRDGRYEQARSLLEALYADDPMNVSVLRGLAVVAQQTGDRDGVVKYCDELLALDNSRENQLLQIRTYLDVGMIREGALKLAAFRELHQADPEAMLLDALVMMTQGRLDEALDMVNRILEVNGTNAQAWRLRGRIHRLKGNHMQAVDDLQRSKSLRSDASISMDLARAYRQTNRMTAAIGELRSALNDPLAPPQLRTMLEQFYMDAGQKNELRTFYAETLAKYPQSEFWHLRAAQFYLREKDAAKAEQLLANAWDITRQREHPSQAIFDLYLETLFIRARYDALLSLASQYTDTELASVAYAQMGQAQARLGNRDLAVQHYHKALEKCGADDTRIAGVLQNMSATVGVEEAEKWSLQKLAASPDSVTANLVMFHLAGRKADYNTALKHLDRGVAALPQGDPARAQYVILKALTYVQAYMKTRDKQYLLHGISQYEKLLADQPNNVSALNNLAFLLADNSEQLDKARDYAARALAAMPDNANVMDTYAYVLCKLNDFAKAEEVLLKAVQLYELEAGEAPAEVYKHLGMAREGLGKKPLAAEAYRRALEVGGSSLTENDRKELNEALARCS
ncbi:MAG TPA: tetratricopeptide repeat protein [Anaerohalosphaeraceae bacterium]|jgi:tetratricopeptide (TPR) repeat protein|nr:tetratricopeptide repeat protein [Anaerohalosphaeraceae bacterium]HRT49565.1 tetratricopeptide repeat protein [Anaerohalosphaeraceae bacterium]HRT85500.1 tetratricopeptide repeat protein [Anaerohalosphaeraceae bacterium]